MFLTIENIYIVDALLTQKVSELVVYMCKQFYFKNYFLLT